MKKFCCDSGAKYLRWQHSGLYAFEGDRLGYVEFVLNTPPQWGMIAAYDRDVAGRDGTEWTTVKFCPFCGVELPKFKLKLRRATKFIVIIDGGYYCDTCKKRLNACRCKPPDQLWEPV